MNKNEIVADIANNLDVPATTVAAVIDDFAGLIIDRARAGQDTSWPTLGKFSGVHQAARQATNPATGGKVDVPAKMVLKYKAGAKVKRQVNGEE